MSEARKSIDDLLAVMAALRTPGTGCPWDLEQTFATIAPYTIEEAYEVADAIERGDLGDLKEELGDLLLQVVYHSRMAEEQGAFAFADVVEAITRQDGTPPSARVRHAGAARRGREAGVLGAHQGRGEARARAGEAARRAVLWTAFRSASRPSRAPSSCRTKPPGGLRLAVAGAGPRQAQGGAGRAGGRDRQPAKRLPSRQDRGGIRRPPVRHRQRRAPPRSSIRRPRCAPPTQSSPAASTPSSASSPPMAARRRNRRLPRWTRSGTRPRLRRKGEMVSGEWSVVDGACEPVVLPCVRTRGAGLIDSCLWTPTRRRRPQPPLTTHHSPLT